MADDLYAEFVAARAQNPRIRAGLSYLGIKGVPTKDEIVRARKAKAQQVHPDKHQTDKAKWTREFQNLEDVTSFFFTSGDKLKVNLHEYGLWLHDAIIHESSTRELVVLLVIAAAGAGKTRGWAKRAAAESRADTGTGALTIIGRRLHTIYACPTIQLMDEVREHLIFYKCNPKIIMVINSAEKNGESVRTSLQDHFALTPRDRESILICSHTAMIDYFPVIEAQDWDLVFDEMPDMTKFLEFYIPSYHWRMSSNVDATPCTIGGAYKLTIKPGQVTDRYPEGEHVPAMHRIAINEPYDELRAHFVEFARALVLHRTVLVPQDQWDALTKGPEYTGPRFDGLLNAIVVTGPNHIRRFRSVRFMGARAASNLSKLIWERLYGELPITDPNQVKFDEDATLGLPKKHTKKQSKLVRVWYIFDEPTTRSRLARRIGNIKLFMLVCRAVEEFHARLPYRDPRHRRFVWSAPMEEKAHKTAAKPHGVPDDFWSDHRTHVHAFDPALRLSGKPHGSNKYLRYRNVAILSVVNLTPHQYDLLHAIGLTDDEIQQAVGYDQAYQAALRIAIRDGKVDHTCNITVMDKATADDLAGEFIDPQVRQYPADLIADLMMGRKNRGQRQRANGKSTDRVRAYRARQRAERLAAQEQKDDDA